MPKKTLVYRDFSGGEVTSANPRTIKQNQLQLLSGMLVDEQGYLTTLYPPQKASKTAAFKDSSANLTKGRGFFYMRSDYSYVENGNFAVTGGPFDYLILVKSNGGTLDITNGTAKDEDVFDMGDGSNVDFYFHNNVLRISDANFVNGQWWFGPIGTGSTKKILGAEFLQRWHSTLNTLPAPTYGLSGRVAGTGHADSDTTSIVPIRQTDLAGTATVGDNSGAVVFTSASHAMLDGDTVILSGTEFYAGSHIVVNKATNTFEISKTYLAVAADEVPEWRRKGDPDWFAGFGSGGGDIAAAASASKWFIAWSNQSTTEMRKCTAVGNNDITTSSATEYDAIAFEIYP